MTNLVLPSFWKFVDVVACAIREQRHPRMAASILAHPTVTLRQGKFKGTTSQGSLFPQLLDIFLGIPYALAPTGDRRFRPPVKVKASTENFNATHWGPRCPSGGLEDPEVPDGEDCLNLNVFRPRVWDQNRKLPVLVCIHGGSFNFGYAKATGISSLVAWSPEPLIGVSFNYRLGALGFLPSKVTAKEGLLNLGLRDQSLLLEWVQENISAFGGNPDDVAVMGCSAGAHSVSTTRIFFWKHPFIILFYVKGEFSLSQIFEGHTLHSLFRNGAISISNSM